MIKKPLGIATVFCAVIFASLASAQTSAPSSEQMPAPAPEQTPASNEHRPAAFVIQDNEFRYEYSSWYRDPFITVSGTSSSTYTGNPQNIAKNVLGFTHVDMGNKLGDNVFDIQLMMDNTSNPVSVPYFHDSTFVGSKDFYTTFRHDFVIDRLVNRDLGIGPIKNWILEVGADLAEKNDDFGNQRRSPMIGPGVNFKVPNGGYWKLVAMWTREWNNEGTDVTSWWYTGYSSTGTPNPLSSINSPASCLMTGYTTACVPTPRTWGQKVVYSPREFTFQTSWGVPFALGNAPMIFEGFSTLNSAKGYGAGQLEPFTGPNFAIFGAPTPVYYHMGTRPEWYTHARLMYNFGSLLGSSHVWQVGVGYEYWHNEFGVGQNTPGVPNATYDCTSCIGNTPFLSVAIHL